MAPSTTACSAPAAPDAGRTSLGCHGPRRAAATRSGTALGPPARGAASSTTPHRAACPVYEATARRDAPRPAAPRPAAALLAQRTSLPALAYDRAARRADAVIVISEFVRRRALDLLDLDPARVHVTPLGVDHDSLDPGDGRARALPRLPRASVAAQEPPDALRGAPARPPRAAGRAARPHRGGELGGVPDGVEVLGNVPRARLVDAAPAGLGARLPVAVRGLRPAAARGDGVRMPVACSDAGALPEVVGDAAPALRPDGSARDSPTRCSSVLADPAPWVERGLDACRRPSGGTRRRAATEDVYAAYCPSRRLTASASTVVLVAHPRLQLPAEHREGEQVRLLREDSASRAGAAPPRPPARLAGQLEHRHRQLELAERRRTGAAVRGAPTRSSSRPRARSSGRRSSGPAELRTPPEAKSLSATAVSSYSSTTPSRSAARMERRVARLEREQTLGARRGTARGARGAGRRNGGDPQR